MGGGGKTSTSSSQVQIPASVLAQYNSVNQAADQTAQTPFSTYGQSGTAVAPDYSTGNTGTFVAPINSEQTSGIAATNTAATEAQPYYSAATGVLGSTQASTNPVNTAAEIGTVEAASPITGADINSYLSPYLGDVLSSTEALQNQSNQQQQAGQLGDAITSGAFGSDRTGIAAANLEEQQNLANNSTIANIANTGFTTAQGEANTEQQAGLAGANQLASIGSTAYGEGANTASELGALGTGAQTAGLAGANAQIAAGTVEQQTQQAQDTAQYNQFLQQQSYPFQVDQFLANIAEGTGALSGSTTTTTQPGGFFSDRRLKRDIKKIGETFDHQDVVTYKMGDDERTRIGLIAQDVEKKHPDAVGVAGGFKVVDYGKATAKAANQGHFYAGGVVPMIRRKRDTGGGLGGVLQAQQTMYAAMPGGGQYQRVSNGSGSGGGHSLAVANAPASPPPSGISQVNSGINTVNNGYKLYGNLTKPATPSTPSGVVPQSAAAPATQPAGLQAAGLQPSGATTFAAPADSATPGAISYAAPEATAAPAADAAAAGAGDVAAAGGADAAAGAVGTAAAGAGAEAGADAAAALAAEYAAADLGTVAILAAKRGGKIRHGFDGGGTPYLESGLDSSGDLNIPEDPNTSTLKAAPGAGKQPTGFQNLLTMANPTDWSTLAGSTFSNQALATGGVAGRRGYDDGGAPVDDAPELPQVTVDGTTPNDVGPASYGAATGVAPAAAPSTDESSPGGLAALWDKVKGSPLAKTENWVPLLSAIGAMGTAKTVHPGVALAAGLGAGANSYVDTQTALAQQGYEKAQTQAVQIANQLNTVKNQAVTDALAGKGPYASTISPSSGAPAGGAPPTTDPGATAAALDQRYRSQYATPPITPQEQDYNNRMNALSAATGNPQWAAMGQKRQEMRVQQQTFANQQAAQHEADGLYQVATTDPDPINRNAALAQYNMLHQWTGDSYDNVAGSIRNKRTGQPPIGIAAQTLTPEQQANVGVATRGQDIGAREVKTDENGTPWLIDRISGNMTATDGSGKIAPIPAAWASTQTPVAPGGGGPNRRPSVPPPAPPSAPNTPGASASGNYLPGINFDALPKTTPQSGFSTKTGQITPEEREKYRTTQATEAAEAAAQDAKTRSIISAAQNELTKIPPRAVGPGSDVYNGFQRLRTAVTGSAPNALVDQGTLDKYLNQLGAQNVRALLSGQRITNQEMMMFMSRGSPNVDQPIGTLKNLVNYLAADTDYDSKLQNTKIEALTNHNADPWKLPGVIDSTPGASRSEYVQSKLGFTPAFTPKQRPGQAPATAPTIVRTGTVGNRRVVQYSDGSVAYAN